MQDPVFRRCQELLRCWEELMPNPFRVRVPQVVRRAVREAAVPPPPRPAFQFDNWQVQALQQAGQAQQQPAMNVMMPDELWQPKKKSSKQLIPATRALPNGRMRNVKLGDILTAYKRTDAHHRDKYVMIDFRPVKVGDYFLSKRFGIE